MGKGTGTEGIGVGGETKYGAESATVIKNGGNTAIQDHITTEASTDSLLKSKSNA